MKRLTQRLEPVVRAGLAAVALVASSTSPGVGAAQRYAHRDVPAGSVTGLELGVDGALEVPAGGRLRWFVTVYEVIAHRDLRPAPGTTLSVLASFRRSEAATSVVTDTHGRAAIELDVPPTLEGSFELVVEARAPHRERAAGARALGITRRFDVSVRVLPRDRVELFVDRSAVAPGATVLAWGRVIDVARGEPARDRPVRVAVRTDERGLDLEPVRRTDARGVFGARLQAPDGAGAFQVVAVVDGQAVARVPSSVVVPEPPDLVVYATPSTRVALPGARVWVDVVVRTPDGRPVAGAALSGLSIPEVDERRHVSPTRSDARGRARVPWDPAAPSRAASYRELGAELTAVRSGIGTGSTTVRVRVGRADAVVTFAVEGGALVPGLPGALYVRVQRPDGTPRADEPISLASSRLVAAAARTDEHGMAVFETRWTAESAAVESDEDDTCAGPTVAAATVRVGTHEEPLCIPVDPDATVRVRARPVVERGGTLHVELLRRGEIARAPLAVMLLARTSEGASRPLLERVVGAGVAEVALPLPAEVSGLVWVRARALIGAAHQEVRGGGTLAWVAPAPAIGVSVGARTAQGEIPVEVAGATAPSQGFVLAVPVEQGRTLVQALSRSHGAARPEGDVLGAIGSAAELAARTPTDVAAPSVLRDGTVLPMTMPDEPVGHGLLRDPWRTRARFVRGRLGRLFRAIQDRVSACAPGSLDEVAVRTRAGWRFNRELLTPILQELGPEAVSGLDGSELDLDALVTLDPGFTFDRVARRITRERLLRVLVALDAFVREHGLGYAWARHGEPAGWLSALPDEQVESSATLEPADLFDAWGHPLALRRAAGGRSRFRFLEPVVGYELVSAGPDGVFATADDVWDPFARVLAPGSLYGEAVGEELLMARLHGVELGRATIDALASYFEIEPASWESSAESSATSTWGSALAPLPDETDTLRVWTTQPVYGELRALSAGNDRVALALDAEPRRYLVVAGAYGPRGELAFGTRPLAAGVPLVLQTSVPAHLTLGDRLRVALDVTWLGRGALTVRARARGPLEVVVHDAAVAEGPAGERHRSQIELAPSGPGPARLRLEVVDAAGRTLRTLERRIRIGHDGTLRSQHTGALVRGQATLTLDAPTDASPVRNRLVLVAPLALASDPGFRDAAREETPEIVAWAHAVRGETVEHELLGRLARSPRRSTLESACAAVVWSAAEGGSASLQATLTTLRETVSSSPRETAATLVALSPVASGLAPAAGAADPVATLVARARRRAWAALATERDDPGLSARFAAGLLLSDQRDTAGRALFERARAALLVGDRGARTLPPDPAHDDDGIAGTAALAIAARQLGHDSLADELARALAPRVYLAMRDDPATAFWLLAASALGAFGGGDPGTVRVSIDGAARDVALRSGALELPLDASSRRIEIRSRAPLLARVEARYVRPVRREHALPLTLRLEGEIGRASDSSALEVVVQSHSDVPLARPVIEIALPSAASFDEARRRSLESASGVARVEPPDRAGVLRIVLAPLSPERELRIPLALRWIASGRSRGLALTAYDDATPWRRTSLPARTLELREDAEGGER